MIAAGSSLYLASNATVFQSRYGFSAFGQFTRNLSNKSQNLVLSDAFGNEIDKVEYFDNAPWPAEADGDGSYLQLIDYDLDNNLASSWIAASISTHSIELSEQNFQLHIYPNPVNEIIGIKSNHVLERIEIMDVRGKMVYFNEMNEYETSINVNALEAGLYFIRTFSNFNVKSIKFIKE
jgi:hypothetical protein